MKEDRCRGRLAHTVRTCRCRCGGKVKTLSSSLSAIIGPSGGRSMLCRCAREVGKLSLYQRARAADGPCGQEMKEEMAAVCSPTSMADGGNSGLSTRQALGSLAGSRHQPPTMRRIQFTLWRSNATTLRKVQWLSGACALVGVGKRERGMFTVVGTNVVQRFVSVPVRSRATLSLFVRGKLTVPKEGRYRRPLVRWPFIGKMLRAGQVGFPLVC